MKSNKDELGNENEEKQEKIIFICSKCGFMYDLSNPPKHYLPFNYYVTSSDPSKVKCPKCGKKVDFQTISEEKYKEIVEKQEKKKEEKEAKNQEAKRAKAIAQIKDDLKELAKDLKDRLFDKEITPKRFVAIFTNTSKNIVKRYNKVVNVDWIDFRNSIYDISDGILGVYKEQEKAEDIIQEYQDDIEKDELYKAEMEYYIEDNKFAIPDYELRKRIAEYERVEKNIKNKEYKKEIEEKYQSRRNDLLKRAEERERRQKLRDIL